MQRIHATIADLASLDLKALRFKGGPEQRSLAAQYIAGAFMAILIWWLDHGAKVPPHEVDHIFQRLVMRGLAVELGLRPPTARTARA